VTVYGQLVGEHGLAASHRLLLAAVPDGARVLDVGCAEGYVAAELSARGCTVVGVEASAEATRRASGVCETVITGDIEEVAVRTAARSAGAEVREAAAHGDAAPSDRRREAVPYDFALFAEAVLRWAAAIADRVVVSLPNIAHWTARRQLLRGRWPQEDHGLFDRTHLRFFTRATARALVEDAGLTVEDERFAGAPLPLQSRIPALERLQPRLVSARPELFALQIVLTARSATR
jgi:SAM-dependent methyltransferase